MWELEEGAEDEKEGSKRARRERVLKATLRARMTVEQSTKRDRRTRSRVDGWGQGEGIKTRWCVEEESIGISISNCLEDDLLLDLYSLVNNALVLITFSSQTESNPRPKPNWARRTAAVTFKLSGVALFFWERFIDVWEFTSS